MPSQAALERALAYACEHYVDNPASQAHAARIAFKVVGGRRTSERCVQIVVPQKLSSQQLDVRGEPRIFDGIYPRGLIEHVDFDIVEGPRPQISLLWQPNSFALAAQLQTQCHEPTIGGGAQIQPANANWVGTLGMMLRVAGKIAAITNAHVSGLGAAAGLKVHQPDRRTSAWFAAVVRVVPIDFARNAQNLVDLAVLDPRDADGSHTVKPQQIGIGTLGKRSVRAQLGMQVIKSGRTTGVTRGVCVGVQGVQHVSYGAGKTARFVDQDIFESERGTDFSAAGDSGSAILASETLDLVALLFAGGGSETIGCPERHVLAAINGTMFTG